MERPLVSVITATRGRPDEAMACIDRVRAQSYRPLEHVMVSDGPDRALRLFVEASGPSTGGVSLVFQETGRVWSDELAYSPGAVPFMVAQFLASGTLQMWLSDDEEMDPDHIALLVDLLEETESDFVYSRAEWYCPSQPHLNRIIGTDPPTPDQLTNALYRTALLDYGKFETHVGRGTDWHQVSHWLAADARYAMLDRVTFRHRADQVGGQCAVQTRQPLRGHTRRDS
jgi:hypothetical protein